MRYILFIYVLLVHTSAALAAPSSIPSVAGWADFAAPNKEATGLDSIDRSQIENHPLNQDFPPPSGVKPVTLVGEGGANTPLDATLNTIMPQHVELKPKTNAIKELKTRKVYDYREKPPAPFFQKEQFGEANAHLPGVFYQSDFTRLLFSAADKGDIGATSSLLGRGADINGRLKDSGTTPLIFAAQRGFGNLVQYLVLRGANVNLADNMGKTPLHAAAVQQDYATIDFLIENGAKIDALDKDGKKPFDYLPDDKRAVILISHLTTQAQFDKALLDFAAANSYAGISLAIGKGAHVDACNANGDTALLIAARAGNKNMVTFLLAHGANPLKVDRHGMSAMDYAVKQKNEPLAQLIETYTIKHELEHGVSRPKKHIHHHVQPHHIIHKVKECDDATIPPIQPHTTTERIEEKALPNL